MDLHLGASREDPRVRLAFPAGKARLSDLVPAARRLADEVVRRSLRDAVGRGQVVPCRKGCCACCRYLVPLSTPEASRLCEEVQSLGPRRRRRVLERFSAAARRILRNRPPRLRADARAGGSRAPTENLEAISAWYSGLDLPCPFLVEDTCGFYPVRPIACREHFAVGAGRGRGDRGCAGLRTMGIPFSASEVLARVAAEVEGTPIESVMLPLAPGWQRANAQRSARTWPGGELAERFAAAVGGLTARLGGCARSVHAAA